MKATIYQTFRFKRWLVFYIFMFCALAKVPWVVAIFVYEWPHTPETFIGASYAKPIPLKRSFLLVLKYFSQYVRIF